MAPVWTAPKLSVPALQSRSSLKEKALSGSLCSRIAGSAADFGAECLVTACPLCKYNLSRESSLPVVYFTELLAEALGITEVDA